jgi:hypothetical protein
MITVGTYYKREYLEQILDQISQLADELRPSHFGIGERKPVAANKISSLAKYKQFASNNSKGYFLFSKRCRYDITTNFISGYGTVYVDPIAEGFDDGEATHLFDCLADAGEFTFACETTEYHFRNRLRVVVAENSVEAWVGRDLGKYVPGIYWLTGASAGLVSQFALGGIADELREGQVYLDNVGRLRISLGRSSSDWGQWGSRITDFCVQYPGVFSNRAVLTQVADAADYLTLSRILARWK